MVLGVSNRKSERKLRVRNEAGSANDNSRGKSILEKVRSPSGRGGIKQLGRIGALGSEGDQKKKNYSTKLIKKSGLDEKWNGAQTVTRDRWKRETGRTVYRGVCERPEIKATEPAKGRGENRAQPGGTQ